MPLECLSAIGAILQEFCESICDSFPETSGHWRISGTPTSLELRLGGIPATLHLRKDSEIGWFGEGGDGVKHFDHDTPLEVMQDIAPATIAWLQAEGRLTDLAELMLTEVV